MRALIVSVGALLAAAMLLHFANGMSYTLTNVRLSGDGVSATLQGLVGSFYFAGYLLGPFVAVRTIRAVGHIRSFCLFAALVSIGVLNMALVGDVYAWAVSRFAMGLSLVSLLTVTESWLNDRTDSANRGQLLSVYFIIVYAAQAGGTLTAGAMSPWTFYPFVFAAMLFALCLAPVALTRIENPTPPQSEGFGFRRLFRISPLAVVGAVACGVLQSAAYTIAPVYVLAAGFESGSAVAGFQAAAIIGSVVLSWPIGKLSDRIDRRTVLIGVAVACGVASLALAFAAAGRSIAALYILAALYGGLATGLYSLAA
ncbi:MAG: MFS transporter, partial [Pseudomonadota bacterium]